MYLNCPYCGHRDHISEYNRAGKFDFVCPICYHLINFKGEKDEKD